MFDYLSIEFKLDFDTVLRQFANFVIKTRGGVTFLSMVKKRKKIGDVGDEKKEEKSERKEKMRKRGKLGD